MAKSQPYLTSMLRSSSAPPSSPSVRPYSCRAAHSSFHNVRKVQHQPPHRPCVPVPHRSLAQVRSDPPCDLLSVPASAMLVSPSPPRSLDGESGGQKDHKPPDERIVKLGKTLRILSSHLPTLLVHPLPPEILSPHITLHLFPSTHPHLPAVKGKVPYRAALWTAPVAWGSMPSMPIVGNVKLRIMSERMVRAGSVTDFDNEHTCGGEKLIVRWVTEGNAGGNQTAKNIGAGGSDNPMMRDMDTGNSHSAASSSSAGTNKRLSSLLGGEAPIFKLGKGEQFTGLFIFSFDDQGRIVSHTIEHADENAGWDRTAKVVTLTDWLLGRAKGEGRAPEPVLTATLHPDETHRLAFRAAMSGRGGRNAS